MLFRSDTLAYAGAEYNHAIQRECVDGHAELAHAGDVFAAQLGASHPSTLTARFALAGCLAESDRPAAAAALTAILDACRGARCPPTLVAGARYLRGTVQWELGDHAAGLAAVREARAALAALGPRAAGNLDEIDAWLRAHRR